MYYEYDDISMDDAKKEINTYVETIVNYLTTDKMATKAG